MNTVWFAPETAPLFAVFALFSLLSLLDRFTHRGQAKRLVLGCYLAGLAVGALLMIAGAYGYFAAQPVHVYQTLIFTGAMLFGLLGYYLWRVKGQYGEFELRKSIANDL